jgi:hypothetical protein
MAGLGKGKGEKDEEIEKIVSTAEEVRMNCEGKGVKVLVLMPCVTVHTSRFFLLSLPVL